MRSLIFVAIVVSLSTQLLGQKQSYSWTSEIVYGPTTVDPRGLEGQLLTVELTIDSLAVDQASTIKQIQFFGGTPAVVRVWIGDVEYPATYNFIGFSDQLADSIDVAGVCYLDDGPLDFRIGVTLDPGCFSFTESIAPLPTFVGTKYSYSYFSRSAGNGYICQTPPGVEVIFDQIPYPTEERIEDLLLATNAINIASGINSSLDAKIENALDAYLVSEDRVDTANKLEAFKNSVEAQRAKKISDADADTLIASANAILDLL